MRKLLLVYIGIICSLPVTAQTGYVLVANVNSPYTITPTTVDSTTTVSVEFINTLSITNSAIFSGLNAPFSTSEDTIVIPAYDTATVDIIFNPITLGNFTDTLEFIGTVFGSGQLILNAEGVLVVINTSVDSLNMGTISLGTSITDSISVYNNGTGTMNINNIISSSSDFIVSPSSAVIAEGDSIYVYITFSPLFTGLSTANIEIESNDPVTPIYNIFIEGSSISEISGPICGTLSLVNSPYTLVDDITVSDTCTLVIEPGVIVNCDQYSMFIDGTLQAIGSVSDSIMINNFNIISMNNRNGSDSVNYVSFKSNSTSTLKITNKNNNSINNTTVIAGSIANSNDHVFNFENGQLPQGWSSSSGAFVSNYSGYPGYGIFINGFGSDQVVTSGPIHISEENPRIILDYRITDLRRWCDITFFSELMAALGNKFIDIITVPISTLLLGRKLIIQQMHQQEI